MYMSVKVGQRESGRSDESVCGAMAACGGQQCDSDGGGVV